MKDTSKLRERRNRLLVIGLSVAVAIGVVVMILLRVFGGIRRAQMVLEVTSAPEMVMNAEEISQLETAQAKELAEERKQAEKAEEDRRKAEEERLRIEREEAITKAVTGGQKLIALTFDDGPTEVTEKVLDALKEKNVRATFFVVGTMVQSAPGILQREAREGHEIDSHTTRHGDLTRLNADGVRAEMAEMNRLVQGITGKEVRYVRPPYGYYNRVTTGNIGVPMVIWSVDPMDWKYRDAAVVRRNAVQAAFDGAIILLHDIHPSTAEAVPGIIDDLTREGYTFLTVTELAKARGVKLVEGEVYGMFRPGATD